MCFIDRPYDKTFSWKPIPKKKKAYVEWVYTIQKYGCTTFITIYKLQST